MKSPIVANVSLLFAKLPVVDRFEAARRAGFDLVESWWPFTHSDPTEGEVNAILAAIDSAGVTLTGLNLYAGDMPAGDRGVLSHHDRIDEFERSLSATRVIADATGCRLFNALYGLRQSGITDETAQRIAVANLEKAAAALPGSTLLLEPLSTAANGNYPLVSLADAEVVRARAATLSIHAVGLLFDTFHLAANGCDLEREIREHAAHIAHVQLADNPGRGAPGTGVIDFGLVLRTLDDVGYTGSVAAEFAPGDFDVSHSAIDSSLFIRTGAPE